MGRNHSILSLLCRVTTPERQNEAACPLHLRRRSCCHPKKNYVCIELYKEPFAPGTPAPPTPANCEKCRADAIALSLTQYCYIPECNEDNTFKAYQYDKVKDESFCFNIYGAEI